MWTERLVWRAAIALAILAGSAAWTASSVAAELPVWPAASELTQPPNAAAPGGQSASLNDVTCLSAGNCTAVGSYNDPSGRAQPMIVTETGGHWGAARQLPLPANAAGGDLFSVSCAAAGTCVAVGSYTVAGGSVFSGQPLIVSETGGVWGGAVTIVLPANADVSSHFAFLNSVACTGPGTCVVAGGYTDTSGNRQALTAAQHNGLWSAATQLPLPADASSSVQLASLSSVTCTSVGNCAAVGVYVTSDNVDSAPMTVAEHGGVWGIPTRVVLPPGASTALQTQSTALNDVTCSSAGNCTAVGYYTDTRGFQDTQAMTVAEAGGVWGQAVRLKLPANLATAAGAQSASLLSVSCTSVGSCVAAGAYAAVTTTKNLNQHAMVATETAGSWAHATELLLPANAAAGGAPQFAGTQGVSCPGVGRCTAVGSYLDATGKLEGEPMAADSVGSLSIPTTTLPWGRVGARYHGQIAGLGGAGRYSWSITGGALPKGLVLNARTGVISGTPRASGWAHFTVTVHDPGPPPQTVSRALALNVQRPRRPDTVITTAKIDLRHHRARFTFVARGVASGFQCALERFAPGRRVSHATPRLASCHSAWGYRRLRPGTYVFWAAAKGPVGLDPTPATRRFTIA